MDEFIPESPSQTGKVYGCLLVLDDGSDYFKCVVDDNKIVIVFDYYI